MTDSWSGNEQKSDTCSDVATSVVSRQVTPQQTWGLKDSRVPLAEYITTTPFVNRPQGQGRCQWLVTQESLNIKHEGTEMMFGRSWGKMSSATEKRFPRYIYGSHDEWVTCKSTTLHWHTDVIPSLCIHKHGDIICCFVACIVLWTICFPGHNKDIHHRY